MEKKTLDIATVSTIASMTGLDKVTIRKYADLGWIESRRNIRGWRVFPDPEKTVQQIKDLLSGAYDPRKEEKE